MQIFSLALLLFVTFSAPSYAKLRPFAEYETVKFVAMSAAFDYQTLQIKRAILSNLPEGVQALVYSPTEAEWETFQRETSDLPASSFIHLPIRIHGEALWSRDSAPYPLIENGNLVLVNAPYYEGFEPDSFFASALNAELRNHKYYFEHGNFTANRKGLCLVVLDNFANQIPDSEFQNSYGCTQVERFPFIAGIGHVDEVIKFLSDDVVITDQPSFVERLENLGLKVTLLPKAETPSELVRRGVMPQRTYINSLLVNGTAFVPVYGLDSDALAIEEYRKQGLKVIPIDTTYTSDYGGGSLHCSTMTYPDRNIEPQAPIPASAY